MKQSSSDKATWEPEHKNIFNESKLSIKYFSEASKTQCPHNDGPLNLIFKIKDTYPGKFYLKHLKRIRLCQRIALKIYLSSYRILSRLHYIWKRLIHAGALKSQALVPLVKYCHFNGIPKDFLASPTRIQTPPPSVYPNTAERLLISPHVGYTYPEIFVATLDNAVVTGATNLIKVNRKAIHHDLFNIKNDYTSEELHGRIHINTRRANIHWLKDSSELHNVDEAACFTDACAFNYAHWITETLPRIAMFCSNPQHQYVPLIVDALLHPNVMDSLYQIAGNNREIFALGASETVTVKKLYVTSVTGYVPFEPRKKHVASDSHGLFSPVAFNRMKSKIFDRIKDAHQECWPERIFLRRNSGARRVENADAIEAYLSNKGYVIVEPEKLSFTQQVLLFNNAKIIIGSSGAALANIVFANNNTKIFILIGDYEKTSFWYWQNIACACENNITYVIGQCTKSDQAGIHSNFIIDMDNLTTALEGSENTE